MLDGFPRVDMQLDRSAANILQKHIQRVEWSRTKRRRTRKRRDTSRLLSRTDGGGGWSWSEKWIARLQYNWSIVSSRHNSKSRYLDLQNRFLPVVRLIVHSLFIIPQSLTRLINSFSEPSEAKEVLQNLSMSLYPQVVSFQEITRLMQQCELLDGLQVEATSTLPTNALSKGSRIAASSITLLSGILPGWSFILFSNVPAIS